MNAFSLHSKKTLVNTLFSIILILALLVPGAQDSVHAQLAAPMLTFPEDGSTVTATGESGTIKAPPQALPVFSWEPVEGAKTYRIQMSQDINFADATKIFVNITTPNTQYIPPTITRLNDGDWFWRVQVATPSPAGSFSDVWMFTKDWSSDGNRPNLTAPADGATLPLFQSPVFSWTPVIGAGSYRLQISTNNNFTTTVLNIVTLATTYQPDGTIANGDYFWRVIPLDAAATPHEGTPSLVRGFKMDYSRVDLSHPENNYVPVLLEPLNEATPTFTPTFRWTAVRGARDYDIQISTLSTLDGGFVANTSTKNTTFTLTSPLENDTNYYWRVRACNGISCSAWSNGNTPWHFVMRWYIQPVLLTPTATYQYVRFPFFSWTPVPGAAQYRIEVSRTSGFTKPLLIDETVSNTYYTPEKYEGDEGIRYWRVTPINTATKYGKTSQVGQFTSYALNNAPDLVSPLHYYLPNTFPAPDQAVSMNPYIDRSAAYPFFTWQRLFDATLEEMGGTGAVIPGAYHVVVGTSLTPDRRVGNVVWQVKTENLSAAPTVTPSNPNPFNPEPNTTYYWQVTPLTAIDGGEVAGAHPSQPWQVRFNSAKALAATTGAAPQPLRPVFTSTYDPSIFPGYDSAEFVEITPALEWFPLSGATRYRVQISRYADFSSLVEQAEVINPVYVPTTSYGQRSLGEGHLEFGSYYWRVQAYKNGVWGPSWSATWRYQIAAGSQWAAARNPGDVANRLEIARDAVDTVADDYKLEKLYAAQDANYWYFGFDYFGTGTSKYVLYLDIDNRAGSGATYDYKGYPLTADTAHLPEYAIYIDKTAGVMDADHTTIYKWQNSTWDDGFTLFAMGGSVFYDPAAHVVELKIPYQPIGYEVQTGTYSLALVSLNGTGSTAMDTVPENPITSGAATLKRVTTVSEHLSLTIPQSDLAGDPTTYPFVPPFFWNSPAGSPWSGFEGIVHRDVEFKSEAATLTMKSTDPWYLPPFHAWPDDFQGDNTYYWKGQSRYLGASGPLSSWSQGMRFEREGFVAKNLKVSVSQATPTFSWDRVEGAAQYDILVDNDPTFGSPAVNKSTSETSYTPLTALPNATYYWKVRVVRSGGGEVYSQWTPNQQFTLALPVPSGLTPNDPAATSPVSRAPTFCWNVLSVTAGGGQTVLFPWRYRVEVSKGDPEFNLIYDKVDTLQNCWTPVKGYEDSKYYWRVAMIDGGSNVSGWSAVAEFTKQYPLVKAKSPVSGSSSPATPTFTWTAIDGTTPYVHGAATYLIEVHGNPEFSQRIDYVTTAQTTFTPTKKYAEDKTYYWRVRMIDADGRPGPWAHALVSVGKSKVYLPMLRK